MSKPDVHRMLDALAKLPKLNLAEDPTVVMDAHDAAHFDGWQNPVTGFGTARDKTTYNQFSSGRILSENELSALYHGDDLAARMVDVVPDEMMREGFELDLGDVALNNDITDQLEALEANDKIADAIRWGRCFGGGGLLLGADDGRSAATPLVPERVKSLGYLYTFDRRYLWPLTWYRDGGNPKLGRPETYMVTSPSAMSNAPVAVVHESRLILFGGATTGIREREMLNSWDLSVLQRPNDVLANFNIGWNAVSILLADGNQAVFKMMGLSDAIAEGQNEALTKRYALMDQARSILRAIVIDAGTKEEPPEEFSRQQFPMTGIPETLDRMMQRLAAAVQIPVTILMGQSPAGMNATGESDFRWFYDRIRSEQTRKLTPRLRRIVRVMLSTKVIAHDPEKKDAQAIKFKFPPLWTEAPLAKAQTRKTLLEGDQIMIDKGIALPEETALHRLQPDGFATEITLTEDGIKAREAALKSELALLEEGKPVEDDTLPPVTAKGAPPGGGAAPPAAPERGGASPGGPVP